jgi:hypothetical protein
MKKHGSKVNQIFSSKEPFFDEEKKIFSFLMDLNYTSKFKKVQIYLPEKYPFEGDYLVKYENKNKKDIIYGNFENIFQVLNSFFNDLTEKRENNLFGLNDKNQFSMNTQDDFE